MTRANFSTYHVSSRIRENHKLSLEKQAATLKISINALKASVAKEFKKAGKRCEGLAIKPRKNLLDLEFELRKKSEQAGLRIMVYGFEAEAHLLERDKLLWDFNAPGIEKFQSFLTTFIGVSRLNPFKPSTLNDPFEQVQRSAGYANLLAELALDFYTPRKEPFVFPEHFDNFKYSQNDVINLYATACNELDVLAAIAKRESSNHRIFKSSEVFGLFLSDVALEKSLCICRRIKAANMIDPSLVNYHELLKHSLIVYEHQPYNIYAMRNVMTAACEIGQEDIARDFYSKYRNSYPECKKDDFVPFNMETSVLTDPQLHLLRESFNKRGVPA